MGCEVAKQDLDFIVIGAQKSGTTTLFEYLVKHPQLCLPASKEAPFFNSQTKYGPLHYDQANLAASFHFTSCNGSDFSNNGHYAAKLIAILHDPVKRARSHHAMALLEDWDTRSFEEAVRDLLQPEALERSRP